MKPSEDQRIERGKRIKILRAMAGENQQNFANLCDVSGVSVNLWEKGSYNGLSKKGAHKIVAGLAKNKGIRCRLMWLWMGVGVPPDFSNITESDLECDIEALENQFLAIKQETELFLSIVPGSVVLELKDDAMLNYNTGDFVGAVWSGLPFKEQKDKELIVMLEDGRTLLRKVGYDEQNETLFLYATNTQSKAADVFVANPVIVKMADIVRLWRVLPCTLSNG